MPHALVYVHYIKSRQIKFDNCFFFLFFLRLIVSFFFFLPSLLPLLKLRLKLPLALFSQRQLIRPTTPLLFPYSGGGKKKSFPGSFVKLFLFMHPAVHPVTEGG